MNILALGAHCDDLELGCGATLAKYVQEGDSVYMTVVTSSGYAAPDGTVVRSDEVAQEEGRRAAQVIGGKFNCLGYKTFEVTEDDVITGQILSFINKHDIDTVYTHWLGDAHRDHARIARATLMAARHVPRLLMYRSNLYSGACAFQGNMYNDVSAAFSVKLAAIACYASETSRVGSRWEDYFTRQAQNDGQIISADFAECFEAVRYRM